MLSEIRPAFCEKKKTLLVLSSENLGTRDEALGSDVGRSQVSAKARSGTRKLNCMMRVVRAPST